MDGHLYVVGRTSTQSLGKLGAVQYFRDVPWRYWYSQVSTILRPHREFKSLVAASMNTQKILWCTRMRAVSKLYLLTRL